MLAKLFTVFRIPELRQKIVLTLILLAVYRMGFAIPLPFLDQTQFGQAMKRLNEQQGGLGQVIQVVALFSASSIGNSTIFGLGIMPYISASIIMQMATHVVPALGQLRKEGESGRRKITQYTRYGTVVLSTFQAMAAAAALQSQGVVLNPGTSFVLTAAMTLVAGTMFLMWLGEQITERGVGNGISMIILASILSGLPSAIGSTLELVNTGSMNSAMPFLLAFLVLGVTAFVEFMERAQRRITVNYAKRQQGRRVDAGQTSHLPF
jgi:preprotein translocase subunit SecY